MNIRLLERNEISKAIELYGDVVKEMNSRGLYNWNEGYPGIEKITADINNKSLYIIDNNGSIEGIVSIDNVVAEEYDDIKWNFEGPFLSFHRIAIHPNARGKGYGKKLVTFAEELAKERNYNSIRIDSYHRNEVAISIYRGLGYKYVGDISLRGIQEPFYCFEKKVNR